MAARPGGERFGDLAADPFADGAVEEVFEDRGASAPAGAAGAYWGGASSSPPGVEELIRQALDAVASARRAPLSASVLVARDELLEVLQQALDALPDELREARWLLRERQEFLAQRQREADSLMEEVRAQAQRMVQRTEIVRQANQVAQRLVADARDDARRLRHEAEEFCDKKLAAFEIVLDRTARTVRAGRQHLAGIPVGAVDEGGPRGAPADTAPVARYGDDVGGRRTWPQNLGVDPVDGPAEGADPVDARQQSSHEYGVDWSAGDRRGEFAGPAEMAADTLFDQDRR